MKNSALAEVFPLENGMYLTATTHNSMPLWSEKILTPEQFFPSAKDSSVIWSGERKLLLAVLQDAVATFFRYRQDPSVRGRRLFRETHDWFWSTDRQWLCSFESICDNLHLDVEYIRRGLKLYYDPVAFSATPPPVQRRRTRSAHPHLTIVSGGTTMRRGDRTADPGQTFTKKLPLSEEETQRLAATSRGS